MEEIVRVAEKLVARKQQLLERPKEGHLGPRQREEIERHLKEIDMVFDFLDEGELGETSHGRRGWRLLGKGHFRAHESAAAVPWRWPPMGFKKEIRPAHRSAVALSFWRPNSRLLMSVIGPSRHFASAQ
jgi:hypothetical protein